MSSDSVVDILRQIGPSVSSQVVRELGHLGVNPVSARQRIARAATVLRLSGLPHREMFLYLREHKGTSAFRQALTEAFVESNSSLGVAISSLAMRRIVPVAEFGVISGSPLTLKGHVSSTAILLKLEEEELVERSTFENVDYLGLTGLVDAPALSRVAAKRLAEDIIIRAIATWSTKLGLGAYGNAEMRQPRKLPTFGQFNWDFVVPSYVFPLVTKTPANASPGFLVADVSWGSPVDAPGIQYFIRKCETMRSLRNTRPFLGIFVADYFAPEAFQALRRAGLIAATVENLFGKDLADGLRLLVDTLTKAATAAADNPKVIDELFRRLSAIEGAAGNLRGHLLELLVAHCVRAREPHERIRIGFIGTLPAKGQSFEIDVLREVGRAQLVAYECKARGPSTAVTQQEIEEWLTIKVPRARDYFIEHFREVRSHRFEFWTTGLIEPDAVRWLEAKRGSLTRYEIAWKDGSGVRSYVQEMNDPVPLKTLDDCFLAGTIDSAVHNPRKW